VNKSNPFVRDRVLSVNAMMCNGEGIRAMQVNTDNCPQFTEALENQAYDSNGQPDKTQGYDHIVDAGGYFIVYEFPVYRPSAYFAVARGNY
jgi:Terminase RNaseH-like domain